MIAGREAPALAGLMMDRSLQIHVRGPWIASGYFDDEDATARGITESVPAG